MQINTYDEYGVPGSGNASRFGYTGQMWISEIGLYHYRNRVYNPATGRFMQTDPIGQQGGINLYAYAGNDPVNFTDPWGLSRCWNVGTVRSPERDQPGERHYTSYYDCNDDIDDLLNWMSGQPAYFAGGPGGMGIGGRGAGGQEGKRAVWSSSGCAEAARLVSRTGLANLNGQGGLVPTSQTQGTYILTADSELVVAAGMVSSFGVWFEPSTARFGEIATLGFAGGLHLGVSTNLAHLPTSPDGLQVSRPGARFAAGLGPIGASANNTGRDIFGNSRNYFSGGVGRGFGVGLSLAITFSSFTECESF